MSESDPPPSSTLAPRPMPLFVAAGWALGATLLSLLIGAVTIELRPDAGVDIVSLVACQVLAYSLTIFFILRVHAPTASVRAFLAFRRTSAAFYVIAILLGVALVVPADALFGVIIRRFPLREFDDPTIAIFQSASLARQLMMVGAACLVGPILEDVLFRGAIFKPLRKAHLNAALPTIVSTAILFAMVHMEWQRRFHIGLIGLALGFLRQVSGSIVPSAIVHVAYNASAFLAVVYLTRPGGPEADIPTPLWLVASSAALAIGLLGLVHLVGKHSATARRAQELDQE